MPPLAHAYLALADDDQPVEQRTLPRLVAAAVASIVLAVGVPLAMLVVKGHDRPVAALSTKAGLVLDDE